MPLPGGSCESIKVSIFKLKTFLYINNNKIFLYFIYLGSKSFSAIFFQLLLKFYHWVIG